MPDRTKTVVWLTPPTLRRYRARRGLDAAAPGSWTNGAIIAFTFTAGLFIVAFLAALFLINLLAPGSRWGANATQPESLPQIDHQVQQIDDALAPSPTLINRPRTATPWTAAVFASVYQAALAHPRTAFLPRTLQVDHQSVRLLGGWLTNGAFEWYGASGATANFIHGVAAFDRALSQSWPTLSPTGSSYAFVQPIAASQAQALWHRTSQPWATFPGFLSYVPHLAHHPAYLVLWVSRPHSSPAP